MTTARKLYLLGAALLLAITGLFALTLAHLADRGAHGPLLIALGSVGVLLAVCVPLGIRILAEARRSEATLRNSERRFRALIENSSDAIALFDEGGRILYASPATARVVGHALEDFVGHTAFEFLHADDVPEISARLREVVATPGAMVQVTAHVRRADGEWRFMEGVFTNLLDDPAVGAIVNNYRDITERRRFDDALRSSEARYRSLFERNLAGVFRSSLDGRFLDCNEAFARIFGYDSPAELMGRQAQELYLGDRAVFIERLKQAKTLVNLEECYKRRDGTPVWTLENVSLVEPESGTSGALLEIPDGPMIEGTLIDISERKRAQEQIEYQAYHDALTGLPNRLLLKDRLTQALAHARRQQASLVVMFLDLDRFKLVNDTLGHALGDQLLNAVAARLVGSVREGDTVARVGGDEFTLLLPGMAKEDDSSRTARKVLDVIREPLQLEGHEVYVTTSIGIALYPDDGDDAESLMKSADSAMYRAKELGRNGYQHWTRGMNARALERMALEGRLRRALDRGEFRLHYQPIIDVVAQRVSCVEALVRWEDPERGLIDADAFVPTAEECGLIVPLGEWVLRTAARQLTAWHRAGLSGMNVAVNLSASQFEQRNLTQVVEDILAEAGLAPQHLELEITESVAARDVTWTTSALLTLRRLGASISLDDFGTGQSSLSYLRHFPLSGLKIDRSFVREIGKWPDNEAIVRAIIALAHSLKLRVVAEGVETRAQMDFLEHAGCEHLQGFLFGRAVPPAELPALAESIAARLAGDLY